MGHPRSFSKAPAHPVVAALLQVPHTPRTYGQTLPGGASVPGVFSSWEWRAASRHRRIRLPILSDHWCPKAHCRVSHHADATPNALFRTPPG
jgi:hypothetical protein